MAHYLRLGDVPPKRHTQHRRPDGGLYYEELVGEEGFSSDSSLVYHAGVPSALVDARPWIIARPVDDTQQSLATKASAPARPVHRDSGTDVVTGRRLVMGNGDVRISYVVADEASPLYRNAIGDECLFVEAGTATVETVFGHLDVGPGDYVIVPRLDHPPLAAVGSEPLRVYCIEANSHITPPKRYLSRFGQLLEHAPYCERDLRLPTPRAGGRRGRRRGLRQAPRQARPVGTVYTVPEHPFDVVGWDGCLYPYAFNVGDFEPITGRVHQPPPVHQVFEGHGFVICNFVPRKVDYHPLSIPVPVLPLQRRQRRGHVLRRRRLRGAQGLGHRQAAR